MKAPKFPLPVLNEAQAIARVKTQLQEQIDTLRRDVEFLKTVVASICRDQG
jgi:restriction endonuclease S subunit